MLPFDKSQDHRPFDKSQDHRPFDKSQDHRPFDKSQDHRPFDKSQDHRPFDKSQDHRPFDKFRPSALRVNRRDHKLLNQAESLTFNTSTKRQIFHIDFDSFFASVEQEKRPELRGKPMGVTATNGRTCIIASSREAKRLGIKTGARSWEAFKVCPNLVLVPADFSRYWEISQKFIEICKDFSPYTEVFSIDEVFMDVTQTAPLFGGPYNLVKKLKKRIKQEVGDYITVSVGMSYNKLLAKLASGLDKPNGFTEIKQGELDKYYSKIELTDLCGIGERIKRRLNKLGLHTPFDIRAFPHHLLEKEFGPVEAHFLKSLAFGIDSNRVSSFTHVEQVKSVGRNYCLPKNEYDLRTVMQNVFELAEEIGIKLRRLEKKSRKIGISLRGSFEVHKERTFFEYIDSGKDIFDRANQILEENLGFYERFGKNEYIRQISIWTGHLEDKANLTLSLFDEPVKKTRVLKTVDDINTKFGDHTIRNAFLLYADKLTTQPNGYLADKYERKKLAEKGVNWNKQILLRR